MFALDTLCQVTPVLALPRERISKRCTSVILRASAPVTEWVRPDPGWPIKYHLSNRGQPENTSLCGPGRLRCNADIRGYCRDALYPGIAGRPRVRSMCYRQVRSRPAAGRCERQDGLVRRINAYRRCHSMSICRGRCQQCGSGQGNSPNSKASDDTADLMTDFPGRTVRSPRKWID